MAVQLACSNAETQKISGVTNLIEEHRAALRLVERLGKRFMEAEEAEAVLIGSNLDIVMAEEAAVRRQVAIAPVADLREIGIKAAYFKRLMGQGWCELDHDDLHALLSSFANVPA
jgi:hypothetical protein